MGKVEVGEGGGFTWGVVEGWGEKAYDCNWITIKIKKKWMDVVNESLNTSGKITHKLHCFIYWKKFHALNYKLTRWMFIIFFSKYITKCLLFLALTKHLESSPNRACRLTPLCRGPRARCTWSLPPSQTCGPTAPTHFLRSNITSFLGSGTHLFIHSTSIYWPTSFQLLRPWVS